MRSRNSGAAAMSNSLAMLRAAPRKAGCSTTLSTRSPSRNICRPSPSECRNSAPVRNAGASGRAPSIRCEGIETSGKYRLKRAYRAKSTATMASTSDVHALQGDALASADPAKLKEFVERDVFAARGQLETLLAKHPNAVGLWEAYVWSFVIASDPTGVIESARRALARQASPNLLLW